MIKLLKHLFACVYCNGEGAEMAGVFMRSNPSDYGEVWEPCTACGGRGWRLREFFRNVGFVWSMRHKMDYLPPF